MARFQNYNEITTYIAFAVNDQVAGSTTGFSSQSCSSYVRFSPVDAEGDILTDDDGDQVASREVRISNHSDRHPACGAERMQIRFEDRAEEIEDEDGDFDGYEVADWWIAETIAEAVTFLNS